jgi:NAD(P)H-hydrate epimerase
MKLVDSATMRSLDGRAIKEAGVKGLALMENAGRALADGAKRLCGGKGRRISVFTGKGNNGGDGYVAARHLTEGGFDVTVFSLSQVSSLKGDAATMAKAWKEAGGKTVVVRSGAALKKHASFVKHSVVIIDAILGTGTKSELKGLYRDAIDFINGLGKTVVAADLPSGIDAGTGAAAGAAIRADATVTFGLAKIGLFIYPGREMAGTVEVADIGIPKRFIKDALITTEAADDALVRPLFRRRSRNSHKGTYGHVAVLAGSIGKTGAAHMTGLGALRSGVGLVTIGTPASVHAAVEAKTIEAMSTAIADDGMGAFTRTSVKEARAFISDKRAVVLGPGIGTSPVTVNFVKEFINICTKPIVIDADGLNAIADAPALLKRRAGRVVITPHPGEAATLLGTDVASVQADRLAAARALVKKTGAVVVLKGAATVTATPAGSMYINTTGNPGLATGGTGDVLAGAIGAFLAQGYKAAAAAVAGVYIHGLAADMVAAEYGEAGMLASDVADTLPVAIDSLVRTA